MSRYVLCKIDTTRGLNDISIQVNGINSRYGSNELCESIDEIRDKIQEDDELIIDGIDNRDEPERTELIKQSIKFASEGHKVNIYGLLDMDIETVQLIKILKDNINFNEKCVDTEDDNTNLDDFLINEELDDTEVIYDNEDFTSNIKKCGITEQLQEPEIIKTEVTEKESFEEQVLRLHKMGLTKKEIANQCGESGNQVKKILDKNRRK